MTVPVIFTAPIMHCQTFATLQGNLQEPFTGFLNMLRRLQKDYPTAYSACIFDAKGKTFRNDLYQEYKANRAAMPDDLVEQTGHILELVDMAGLAHFAGGRR